MKATVLTMKNTVDAINGKLAMHKKRWVILKTAIKILKQSIEPKKF